MLGQEIINRLGDTGAMVECVCNFLKGEVVAQGKVNKFKLNTQGGFDYGVVTVGEEKERCSISFLNQYMALEKQEKLMATFPDLIIILSKNEGLPIGSSQLQEGQEVIVVVVPKEQLILGTEIDHESVLEQIKEVTTIENGIYHLTGR